MDEMKTALERAMERADRLGKASEEDRKRWKYVPEGERLAAEHLKGERDLLVEIGRYDEEARPLVMEGAQGVLVGGVDLPATDVAKARNKRAMEAIKELKRDKVAVENVYTKMRRVFNHYEQEGEQQRRQVYEEVKREFETKLVQAMQQSGQPVPKKLNVDTLPQFQDEWRRAVSQLDSQYTRLLDEYKQEILSIA